MTKGEVIRRTQDYWANVNIPGLDPGSAAHGLRYGMIIALSHPDYARAYTAATHLPAADRYQEEAIKEFMAGVPMTAGEESPDVALN